MSFADILMRRDGCQPGRIHVAAGSAVTSDGFTLIEVVLALTIFSLLAAIVYGAFSLSQRAVAKVQVSAEHNQRQRAAIDLLGSYIRSAYPYRATPQDQAVFFDGAGESMTFVSAYSHALGGRGLAKIQIGAEQSDDGLTTLSLEEATPVRVDGDDAGGGYRQRLTLRERVKNFRVGYLDSQTEEEIWEEHWDGQERRVLPRAVRFLFEDESGREVRWVFPVMMVVLAP